MRLNIINLQIVKNLGNYETLRIGAEWTPDSNQTLDEAMAAGMAELNAAADVLLGKKKPAQTPAPEKPAEAAAPANDAQKEAEAEQAKAAAVAAAAAAAAATEPDALDKLNAEREDDKRELVTLQQPSKFNKTLGRIASGIALEKVFEHFRFDADTLSIIRAMQEGKRVTLAFGDKAFEALVKAIEQKKDIAKICEYLQFADQQTSNAWDLALKMCN